MPNSHSLGPEGAATHARQTPADQPLAAQRPASLINLVDFKWLMTGIGLRINLTRLQSDRNYGCMCLAAALRSGSLLLREHAAKLLGLTACECANSRSFSEPPPEAASSNWGQTASPPVAKKVA